MVLQKCPRAAHPAGARRAGHAVRPRKGGGSPQEGRARA
jgi:hypothetical protein